MGIVNKCKSGCVAPSRKEIVMEKGKLAEIRDYCREWNYISFSGGWLLLSTAKSGTENRLCDRKVRYHAWGVSDEVSET